MRERPPVPRAFPAVAATLLLLLVSCSGLGPDSDRIPAPSVRVCLTDQRTHVEVGMPAGAVIETMRGAHTVGTASRLGCVLRSDGTLAVTLGGRDFAVVDGVFRCHTGPSAPFDIDGRLYPDTLVFASDGERLYLINVLPVERYLESVVPNEIGRNRKDNEYEAVRAQAILARTYTMAKIDLPLRRLFDVYADTRDQVYTGMNTRSELTTRGVRDTRGLVLTWEQTYAECYFHSTCGGGTEAVSLVWKRPQSKPYLTGIRDAGARGAWCRISPSWRWSEVYTRTDIESLLRIYLPSADDSIRAGDLDDPSWTLRDVRILRRMPSGRVQRLKIVMGDGTSRRIFTLEGDRIRWALRRSDASSVLRSTLFDLFIDRGSNGEIRSVRIDGGGNGHGIGMCQWGAIGRSRAGEHARAILQAYFPGTALARAY